MYPYILGVGDYEVSNNKVNENIIIGLNMKIIFIFMSGNLNKLII